MIKVTELKSFLVDPINNPKIIEHQDLFLPDSYLNDKTAIANFICQTFELGSITQFSGHIAPHVISFDTEKNQDTIHVTGKIIDDSE